MIDEVARKFQKELNAGAISLVILALVRDRGQAMYGYEVAKHLQSVSGQDLPMNQAAIYPVLRSLEKQGLLSSHVVPSNSGPPRKYYDITALGKRALPKLQKTWSETRQFVESILEGQHESSAPSTSPAVPKKS